MFAILRKKKVVTLKLCPLIENEIRNILQKNHAKNMHQKLAPDPFLILLSNPKQRLDARNSFENKIKSLKKVNFIFTFESSPF